MQAIKLLTSITPDRKIVVQLPANVTAETAEVIVLFETAPAASVGRALEAFLAERDGADRPRLSEQDVDRRIDNERNAWE